MIQIRQSVFETNSSSIHSICISKAKPVLPDAIGFEFGEYGWGCGAVSTPNYIYTAIFIMDEPKRTECFEKLKKIMEKNGIEAAYEEPTFHESEWDGEVYKWFDSGYIDHGYELESFIEELLDNEDLLLRCLFSSGSVVYTGHDNMYVEEYLPCRAADATYYDHDRNQYVPNPYHDPENFEYFLKEN